MIVEKIEKRNSTQEGPEMEHANESLHTNQSSGLSPASSKIICFRRRRTILDMGKIFHCGLHLSFVENQQLLGDDEVDESVENDTWS